MIYAVTIGERRYEIEIDGGVAVVDGVAVTADLVMGAVPAVGSLLVDGKLHSVAAEAKGAGEWSIHVGGEVVTVDVVDERTRAIREMAGASAQAQGPSSLQAPMPGMILSVDVEVGQTVEEGDRVATIEAMKMENALSAPITGVVSEVHVEAGQAVEKDQALIDFDPPAEEGAS